MEKYFILYFALIDSHATILSFDKIFELSIFWIIMPDQFEKMYKVPNPKYSFDIAIFVGKFKIELFICNSKLGCQASVFWAHITWKVIY